MAAESFLVQAFATLITEFNRRGLHYALAGGWPRSLSGIDVRYEVKKARADARPQAPKNWRRIRWIR